MTQHRMRALALSLRRSAAITVAIVAGSAALTGCGGIGSTDFARIRTVDAATSAGTVDVLVNNAAAFGDQMNPPTKDLVIASPYLYIGTGSSVFSYLSSALDTTVTANTNTVTLNSHVFYSAFVVGRPDVAITAPNALNTIVVQDTPATPAGKSSIRVIDAAPDAGNLNVTVNGPSLASNFNGIQYSVPTNALLQVSYITITPGAQTVSVSTGTSASVPSANFTAVAGQAYTILVTEPAGGTSPTYAIQVLPDIQS